MNSNLQNFFNQISFILNSMDRNPKNSIIFLLFHILEASLTDPKGHLRLSEPKGLSIESAK